MMKDRDTMKIYSIFGQIEDVAAKIMIEEGTARKIDFADIPETARFNSMDQPAKYAIMVFGRDLNHKFEKLIRDLRA